MEKAKRWMLDNQLWGLVFVVMAILAWFDAYQIQAFFNLNNPEAWTQYQTYVLTTYIWLWHIIFAVGAYVYYKLTNKKYEALGLFLSSAVLLWTGLEDVLYFVFSPQTMSACMQHFADYNAPVYYFSVHVMHEACVSPNGLVLFSIIGIFISKMVLDYFKRRETK